MRRLRTAAVLVLVGSGLLVLAITSASGPAPAAAAQRPPSATTGSASAIGPSNATVNGTVNPNGQASTYFFQYGTSTSYGLQTPPASAGSGTTPVGVHATLEGLGENNTYHYRLVVQSGTVTVNGSDQTLTTTTSQAVVLGHEGFVSPGRIVGAELGCFHGTSQCTGHLTMSHDGVVIAQRDYSIEPDSGGFQNMELNATGVAALAQNGVWHLLPVTVTATATNGQAVSWTIHLARWVWH
jgi:hypothetical protein